MECIPSDGRFGGKCPQRVPHPKERCRLSSDTSVLSAAVCWKNHHKDGNFQALQEQTPPRRLPRESLESCGRRYFHVGCPQNWPRMPQFFLKLAVQTLLCWDFFQRIPQIVLHSTMGRWIFSCASFSRNILTLSESGLPASNGLSRWTVHEITLRVFSSFIHFPPGLTVADYLEHGVFALSEVLKLLNWKLASFLIRKVTSSTTYCRSG